MICHTSQCFCLYFALWGLRVGYDFYCHLEAVLDLGDNSSKFSQTRMKDMTLNIINNIKLLSAISPLREIIL